MEAVVSENAPRHLNPRMLGAPAGTRFVHAATGRGHTLLVGSNGDVWSAGVNTLGQVRPFFFLYFFCVVFFLSFICGVFFPVFLWCCLIT